MTYCLGIVTKFGLVLAADSRTNAGVDRISTYRKLFDFSLKGERSIFLCTAGNLSMTQAVISGLRKDLKVQSDVNLYTLPSLYEIARHIGSKTRAILEQDRHWLKQDNIDYHCSFLLGGQIKGEEPELYMIYSQGNCLQATPETPFLQIGETKYGKPLLDRILTFNTPIEAAAKCALLSIDSTMKSNVSVGPPINLIMYRSDSFDSRHKLELPLGDPYLAKIRQMWSFYLNQAFESMPEIDWQLTTNQSEENIEID